MVWSLQTLLNLSLNLDDQVASQAKSTCFHFHFARKFHPLLQQEPTSMMHLFITSRCDYCNSLYLGLHVKTMPMLQLVQTLAAHHRKGRDYHIHVYLSAHIILVFPRSKALNWQWKWTLSLKPPSGQIPAITETTSASTTQPDSCASQWSGACESHG